MLIFINGNRSVGTINKNIYGHFAEHLGRCIYGGLYVGEDSEIPNQNGMRTDVVNALKELDIPVLRWPGGCFADTYHWQDGIGPKSSRKTLINTTWGGVREDNSFGTHEFMELCRQLGCEAYINGNVGTGTVQEMCDWVEYCNMPGVSPMADLRRQNGQDAPWNVKYWGIGNEMWGGGGNMRADYYSDLCRQYASFLRDYDPSHKIYKIASGACDFNYDWTQRVAELTGALVDALSLHYLALRQQHWNCEFETSFIPHFCKESDCAGIAMVQSNENHLRAECYPQDSGIKLVVSLCKDGEDSCLARMDMSAATPIKLKLRVEGLVACVLYQSNSEWKPVAYDIDLRSLSTEHAGGFVGCTLGLYASGNGEDAGGYSDFETMTYRELPTK